MTRPKRTAPNPLPVEPWLRQFPGVEGFLRAIAEEPWDDTHRLILADWLDERGAEARAEFIRLQVQLAGREPWEVPHEAVLREKHLRLTHGATWHQDLPAYVQFARGLALRAEITADNNTARLTEAARVIDLQELVWPPDEYLPTRFDAAEWGRLLAWCPALRFVTGLRLRPLLPGDPIIRELVLSPHLTALTRVRFFHVHLNPLGLGTLLASPCMAAPDLLDLRGNTLAQASAETLATWPGLASLTALGLRETHLGEHGLRTLTETPYPPALTRLDLNQTEARIATGAHLAAWPALATLTSLDLSVNLLRDDGVAALAACPRLARLTALNLRDNQVGNAGGRALAESPHLDNLTVLDLSHNRIGLAVRQQLQDRWPFVRL
jgi:uncharacterized protein (TIGR02996 family)